MQSQNSTTALQGDDGEQHRGHREQHSVWEYLPWRGGCKQNRDHEKAAEHNLLEMLPCGEGDSWMKSR